MLCMCPKQCSFLALSMSLVSGAFAFPAPYAGTEDIPKMVAASALVCKGEVVEAPTPSLVPSSTVMPHLTETAHVHPDRCDSQPEVPRELLLPRDRLFERQDELGRDIGAIRDPETLPFLERFAVSGKGYILRMNAIQALRAILSPRSAPAFLNALSDPNPDNGFSAMQGLLSLAGPGRVD